MRFHCNKYPYTIKHRVAAMAFYKMPHGMILVAWSSSGYYGHWLHYFRASLVAPTLYILLCNKRHAG